MLAVNNVCVQGRVSNSSFQVYQLFRAIWIFNVLVLLWLQHPPPGVHSLLWGNLRIMRPLTFVCSLSSGPRSLPGLLRLDSTATDTERHVQWGLCGTGRDRQNPKNCVWGLKEEHFFYSLAAEAVCLGKWTNLLIWSKTPSQKSSGYWVIKHKIGLSPKY